MPLNAVVNKVIREKVFPEGEARSRVRRVVILFYGGTKSTHPTKTIVKSYWNNAKGYLIYINSAGIVCYQKIKIMTTVVQARKEQLK